jgi:hypothetical protein
MGFLDNLAKYNASKASGEPAVNPPEASKVLATETAAEVAGRPATAAVTEVAGSASPEPTKTPSDATSETASSAAEPKTRTRRSRAVTSETTPAASAANPGTEPTLAQAIELVACLLPSGSEIKITGRG